MKNDSLLKYFVLVAEYINILTRIHCVTCVNSEFNTLSKIYKNNFKKVEQEVYFL